MHRLAPVLEVWQLEEVVKVATAIFLIFFFSLHLFSWPPPNQTRVECKTWQYPSVFPHPTGNTILQLFFYTAKICTLWCCFPYVKRSIHRPCYHRSQIYPWWCWPSLGYLDCPIFSALCTLCWTRCRPSIRCTDGSPQGRPTALLLLIRFTTFLAINIRRDWVSINSLKIYELDFVVSFFWILSFFSIFFPNFDLAHIDERIFGCRSSASNNLLR